MAEVVSTLTVGDEPCQVGPILRLSVDDAQDIPSIKTEYSDAVPIVLASSAVRRITGLAYMLVWAWSEHVRAAAQLGLKVAGQVILLFDEIDAHLHPRWQRAIIPAILRVMDHLTDRNTGVQLIAATHSPLVLASVEPHFDEDLDRLFHLEIRNGRVHLDVKPWAAQGFRNLCAYSAMYEPVGTVDHFVSCHEDPSKTYEWDNYRYCAAWINSSKGNAPAGDLLDPFDIENGWFEIHLPSLQLRVSDTIPDEFRERAEYVLNRLHLRDDERVIRQRSEWYRMYQCGELSLDGLDGKAPLIAAAIDRA